MPRLRRFLSIPAASNVRATIVGIAALVVLVAVVGACSVDESSLELVARVDSDSTVAVGEGVPLPAVGPAPGSSHWHAAYVVRVCDEVLAPFESEADPAGIHSHRDGLIHVHPFFEESGFERATMGLFADAMGFRLADGELTLPGGGTWRDGDLCDGVPGRVYVDRWKGPDPGSEVTRVFEGLGELRFLRDRELYHIAFAPADAPPVVPPTWERLDQVSVPIVEVEPWVRIAAGADPESVRFYPAADVSAAPCLDGQVAESVLAGEAACFTPGTPVLERAEAISAARAVTFDRSPAVELTITPALRSLILGAFASADPDEPGSAGNGLVIVVEVDGAVVSAPLLAQPSRSETRLIISGGFSVESARALAAVLDA